MNSLANVNLMNARNASHVFSYTKSWKIYISLLRIMEAHNGPMRSGRLLVNLEMWCGVVDGQHVVQQGRLDRRQQLFWDMAMAEHWSRR